MLIATIFVSSVGCSAQSETPPVPVEKRLYGEEAFTITYRTTAPSLGPGAMTVTEHVRNWGYQSVKLSGEKGENPLKTLAENGRFYRFHPKTGQAYWQEDTPTQNLVSLIDQEADRDFGYRRSRFGFGGQPTGETAVFAGHSCSFYQTQTATLMLRVCMTSWGAALYAETRGEVESTQVATEVRIGDPGPDDVFTFDRESALPSSSLQ